MDLRLTERVIREGLAAERRNSVPTETKFRIGTGGESRAIVFVDLAMRIAALYHHPTFAAVPIADSYGNILWRPMKITIRRVLKLLLRLSFFVMIGIGFPWPWAGSCRSWPAGTGAGRMV